MGIKSNNPTEAYYNYFGNSGKDAVSGASQAPPPISATGGTKYTYGDYTIHKFTSSGSLVVASGEDTCEYIIVAGGGGTGCPNHGGGHAPGGAGAGGLHDNSVTIGPGTIPVTIGAGGGAGNAGNLGGYGNNTVVAFPGGSVTGDGGGYGGGGEGVPAPLHQGGGGGCGGGGAGGPDNFNCNSGTGSGHEPFPGTPGDSPPVGWGADGGYGLGGPGTPTPYYPGTSNAQQYAGGGGGGAGGKGENQPGADPIGVGDAGNGGLAYLVPATFRDPTNTLQPGPSSTAHWLAGGGGGGGYGQSGNPGPVTGGSGPSPGGPYGGGGSGGRPSPGPEQSGGAGTANSGGGAGGPRGQQPGTAGKSGGSGIVLIAYPS